MNKRDAIEAMLDGKKIDHPFWGYPVHWDGDGFVYTTHSGQHHMDDIASWPCDYDYYEVIEKKKVRYAPAILRRDQDQSIFMTADYYSSGEAAVANWNIGELVRWPAHESLVIEVEEWGSQ